MISQLETLIRSEPRRAKRGDLENGLTSRVMPALLRKLEGEGNFLTPEQQEGLCAISATIEAMAKGEAGNKFYLSSLPMGMGKTTALAETVKAMLADPARYADVGILILVNQLNLIAPLIERMGLATDRFDPRFAVRVGKNNMDKTGLEFDLNDLGLGAEPQAQCQAQVLVSTQQKYVHKQPTGPAFGNDSFYKFRAEVRKVKVWDEAIAPIHPITLTVKQITGFAATVLKTGNISAARKLLTWAQNLGTSGKVAMVPCWMPDESDMAAWDWSTIPENLKVAAPDEWNAAGWALAKLQGQLVSVHHDDLHGAVAISYFETLPADFAPVLILDAFGEDRAFYRTWANYRGNLEFLADAPKTYRNLTVHWCDIASGKVAHRTPEQKALIVDAGIAAHFVAGAPMLNVTHKPEKDSYDIRADMMEGIKAAGGDPYRDEYLTWGLHTGTNAFLDRKHIFIGGLWRKPLHVYKALYRGVANFSPWQRLGDAKLKQLALTEIAHDLQQAVGRIAVRQNKDGDCPSDCHLWVTSAGKGNMPFTREHFERRRTLTIEEPPTVL